MEEKAHEEVSEYLQLFYCNVSVLHRGIGYSIHGLSVFHIERTLHIEVNELALKYQFSPQDSMIFDIQNTFRVKVCCQKFKFSVEHAVNLRLPLKHMRKPSIQLYSHATLSLGIEPQLHW